MAPAPRPHPEEPGIPDTAFTPEQVRQVLARLVAQKKNLPHRNVRYRTRQGIEFLDTLWLAVKMVGKQRVAEVVEMTPQGVEWALGTVRSSKTVLYPEREDLYDLRVAWEAVETDALAGRTVGRESSGYAAMHQSLQALQSRGFQIGEISLALGVRAVQLRKFTVRPPS